MTAPTFTVKIWFGTTPSASTLFTLNDTTRGKLDSATYTLGGDAGTDVSADCIGFTTRRGKSSQLWDRIDAGTAQIQLNNEDRTYDPLYAAGPYFGGFVPGQKVQLLVDDCPIFTGLVSDWSLSYDVTGRSIATCTAEDALASLARRQFTAWTATASETAATRLNTALSRSEIGWPTGSRDFDSGISVLQADSVSAGTTALAYAQLVAQSDLGSFFAARDGVVTFRDRWSTATNVSNCNFDDTGTDNQFHQIAVTAGSETFYTRVSVTRAGGSAQVVNAATAVDDDIRTLSLTGLLQNSDSQSLDMANFLASLYSTSDGYISQLTSRYRSIGSLAGSSSGFGAAVLESLNLRLPQLELGDVVGVTWTPNGVGAAIEQTSVIQGIEWQAWPGDHSVTFNLTRRAGSPFLLDDLDLGLLDTSTLNF